jgi:ComF family protein
MGTSALDWLCPQQCALCEEPGNLLCAACLADASMDPTTGCRCCALPLDRSGQALPCGRCLKRRPAFDTTVAAASYEAPFDRLVLGLKYGATLAYAPLFAGMLHRLLIARDLDEFDLLMPIPLSRDRLALRGFNQTVEIARPLARRLGKPLDTGAVLRIGRTVPQAALRFDARRRNVRGAFAVVDAHRHRLAGKRIAVVDDVMTTGATLDEFARTLKRAGATAVINLVIARTP